MRAEFTQTSGGSANLIGFCTVQDNTSFGADFRIAKSYGSPAGNFFVQGGNAFGTTALLGTLDNEWLLLFANNATALTIEPAVTTDGKPAPNLLGGNGSDVTSGVVGATVAGGGVVGADVTINGAGWSCARNATCRNLVKDSFGTIGGGLSNQAGSGDGSGLWATVGGGFTNVASGHESTVAGGFGNLANGFGATIAGGENNTASGGYGTVAGGALNVAGGLTSFAAGSEAHADQSSCAVFGLWSTDTAMSCLGSANVFRIGADHGFSVDYFAQRADGGGTRWVYIGDFFAGETMRTWNGANLSDGGQWNNASDRALKTDFTDTDPKRVLAKVVRLPITEWRYKAEPNQRHLGPVAQDFYAAFGLGADDKHIGTLDEGGVALAAIQGLDQLVQAKDVEIERQQRDIAALAARVAELESMRDDLAALKAEMAELRTGSAAEATHAQAH